MLFFSGGSALRSTSRELKLLTHNSVHLMTPFDSGGSSARLRDAFGMLAVGDVRNRLMALADDGARGSPEIYALFNTRLAKDADSAVLQGEFATMVRGEHPLVAAIPEPVRQLVMTHLRQFAEHVPAHFDWRGASIGNLVLAGSYAHNERDIDSVIYLFSQLVGARGTVRPVVNADLHLAATLDDGSRIVGQHKLTGKETPPLTQPIRHLELVGDLDDGTAAQVRARNYTLKLIRRADVICYPMGSFFSSIVANLLPAGVGRAVVDAKCPKVFVPNTMNDPEQIGLSLDDTVKHLLQAVRQDAGDVDVGDILHLVVLDENADAYGDESAVSRVEDMGIRVVRHPLCSDDSGPQVDPRVLSELLVSLA